MYDNYVLLKEKLRKSKRGIAILVDTNYDDVMWIASLDDAAAYYIEATKNLDYES